MDNDRAQVQTEQNVEVQQALFAHHQGRYERDIAHIARKLRDMADEVERRGSKLGTAGEGERPHSDIAAHLTHTIAWGFANLHLDDLVRDAAKADLYQAEEQS